MTVIDPADLVVGHPINYRVKRTVTGTVTRVVPDRDLVYINHIPWSTLSQDFGTVQIEVEIEVRPEPTAEDVYRNAPIGTVFTLDRDGEYQYTRIKLNDEHYWLSRVNATRQARDLRNIPATEFHIIPEEEL